MAQTQTYQPPRYNWKPKLPKAKHTEEEVKAMDETIYEFPLYEVPLAELRLGALE